jgi:hypothetical protein
MISLSGESVFNITRSRGLTVGSRKHYLLPLVHQLSPSFPFFPYGRLSASVACPDEVKSWEAGRLEFFALVFGSLSFSPIFRASLSASAIFFLKALGLGLSPRPSPSFGAELSNVKVHTGLASMVVERPFTNPRAG